MHYNGFNTFLYAYVMKIYQFKANDSALVSYPLCLGNISKDITNNNMKKTVLNGYVEKYLLEFSA